MHQGQKLRYHTHTTVGILNYKSTIHNTPVMSASGAVVQWQLLQRGVHLTPFTPHLHPPVMSPRLCRGGRTHLSIHKAWGLSHELTMTAVTFKCLLVMNEARLMEFFKMMSTTDTYFICNKILWTKASGAWAKFSHANLGNHYPPSSGRICTAT